MLLLVYCFIAWRAIVVIK